MEHEMQNKMETELVSVLSTSLGAPPAAASAQAQFAKAWGPSWPESCFFWRVGCGGMLPGSWGCIS